jgi:hypothetical protein
VGGETEGAVVIPAVCEVGAADGNSTCFGIPQYKMVVEFWNSTSVSLLA